MAFPLLLIPAKESSSATLQRLRSEVGTDPTAAPIAFFYCSKNPGELERADPCQILRALAKQIALSEDQTGILAPVISIHKNKRIQAEQDGLSPPSLNLSECKKLILELTAMTPATIIIDAIDECNSITRHQLLTALEEILIHSHKPVKILVSSQKARDIDVRLDKFACIMVNEKQNKNDIDAFVDLQVATAIESKQMLAGRVSLDLSNRVASILKTKAEGSFRWVALQLQCLCDPDTVKLERDVHDVLLRPPQTLLAFYDSIHHRILAMEKQSQSIAFATFYWLLHAKQLLSVDALLSAVSMSLMGDDESLAIGDILDCCCNLVEIDEVLNVVRLSHSTVQEYACLVLLGWSIIDFEQLSRITRPFCSSASACQFGTQLSRNLDTRLGKQHEQNLPICRSVLGCSLRDRTIQRKGGCGPPIDFLVRGRPSREMARSFELHTANSPN